MLDAHAQPQRNLSVDGITINVQSIPHAVSSIMSAAQSGDNFSVCTLNLDHVVQLERQPDFRAAYRRARLVTADGFPIVVLSRLLGTPIRRTTGADLVEPVCQAAQKKGLPVFMLGSNEHTLSLTANRLRERFQGLRIAGTYAPGDRPYWWLWRLSRRAMVRTRRWNAGRAGRQPGLDRPERAGDAGVWRHPCAPGQ